MNFIKSRWLVGSLLLVLFVVSCGAAPTTPAAQPTLAATPTTASYPAGATQAVAAPTAYPASSGQAMPTASVYPAANGNPAPTAAAYPAPQSTSSSLAWADAIQLIMKGEVTQIVQTQFLDVTLTLKSGGTITTKAPAANSVQNAITSCGDLCKSVVVKNQ